MPSESICWEENLPFAQILLPCQRSSIPLSSISRVAKWLLALQPFRFTVTHIKGEETVAADRLSRIPWPVAMPKAVDVIQLAGELELDSEGEAESHSESEEEGEEFVQEELPQGELVLLAVELVKEHQKGDTDLPKPGPVGQRHGNPYAR